MKTKFLLSFGFILVGSLVLAACNKPSSSDITKAAIKADIDQVQQAADSGDGAAQFKLALRYEKGDGVTQDRVQAFKWFLKSAEGGNVEAMVQVADRLDYGTGIKTSSEEAKKWWKKAAEAGNAKAQYEHAQVYGFVDKGMNWVWGGATEEEQNLKNWIEWLEKSSTQGYAEAKYDLGMLYLLGVKKDAFASDAKGEFLMSSDPDKGVPLLLEAAQKDYWQAQWALAVLYQAGFGQTQPDPAKSKEWWDKLAAQSNARTQRLIGFKYEESDPKHYRDGKNKWYGKSLTFNETNKIAVEWIEKSVVQGDKIAAYYLSEIYLDGRGGVLKDEAKRFQLLKQSAEKGFLLAQFDIGNAYLNGKGVAKDYSRAMEWFYKAANQEAGDETVASAQNNIGVLYENGWGVDKDAVLAYAWYNLASVGGHETFKENFARVEKNLSADEIHEAQSLSRDWKPGTPIARAGDQGSSNGKQAASSDSATGGRKLKLTGSGTGFFISKTGNILTNNHVAGGCAEVRVPAESKVAKLVVADEANDLAVVKMGGEAKASAVIYQPDDLKQGEEIVVFGYPLDGYLPASGNIAQGIVSALAGPGNNASVIQISAPVQQGNSGGPVINMTGQVVGVVVGKANALKIAKVTGDIPQNINFAIAGRTVKSFLDGNRIDYEKGGGFFTLSKNAADLTDDARKYSIKLECWE